MWMIILIDCLSAFWQDLIKCHTDVFSTSWQLMVSGWSGIGHKRTQFLHTTSRTRNFMRRYNITLQDSFNYWSEKSNLWRDYIGLFWGHFKNKELELIYWSCLKVSAIFHPCGQKNNVYIHSICTEHTQHMFFHLLASHCESWVKCENKTDSNLYSSPYPTHEAGSDPNQPTRLAINDDN